ncbi:ABC transporter ATP-binding protein [Mycoplasmopsis pullorum]|uniref:Sugar ABC transporter ATP-binding protein n=1 Tax=Mycoplasmopsis pullorum TaxID=48003 RepID=A0A1L4FSN7_9BACT|nr:ABC transporter ATP-binding protein [Mycoplasmopsis pullorum]APJ38627.1 sugar ABC transporter ATP-binding protein [Mycoplasmopsis pullorum]
MKEINAIEFVDLSKSFGSIKANQNISFAVKKGTIHALIGENGAGKSTLMSILFGLYEPDSGYIKVNGQQVSITGPNDAKKLNIGMVHQHFKLVNVYTNLENVILGVEPKRKNSPGVIDYAPAIEKIKTIQNVFKLDFDLNNKSSNEAVSTRQKVEIMKMLYQDSEILIFDEPTAVLTDQEIQGLLETFRLFKKQGKTIIFISHKLNEIKEVADYATVLRHGKVTGNFKVSDVSIEQMAQMMVGSNITHAANTDRGQNISDEVLFEMKNVSTKSAKPLRDFSLKVHAGEIVAIAGVEGNGQQDLEYVVSGLMNPLKQEGVDSQINLKKTELIKRKFDLFFSNKVKKLYFKTLVLFFLICLLVASIIVVAITKNQLFKMMFITYIVVFALIIIGFGLVLTLEFIKMSKLKKLKDNEYIDLKDYSTFERSQMGLSYIPSDRHKHGLVLDFKISENTQLRRLWDKTLQFFGIFKIKNIKNEFNSIKDKYDVRGTKNGISQARSLSGGNQQKFIVGREMNSEHDFILILQPTRGLDVGAIQNIHQNILEERAKGKGILLISYELDEVLSLADRIVIINNGRNVLNKKAYEVDRTEIGVYMSKHNNEQGGQ